MASRSINYNSKLDKEEKCVENSPTIVYVEREGLILVG
jgi:hypothetical protein